MKCILEKYEKLDVDISNLQKRISRLIKHSSNKDDLLLMIKRLNEERDILEFLALHEKE